MALVHRSVPRHQQSRQAAFVAKHFALSLLILGSAPLFLVYGGAPTHAQIALFVWAFAPLAAAAVVLQSGNIQLGRAIAFASLIALGYVLAFGFAAGVGCALAWLAAAQYEIRVTASGRFRSIATRFAIADALLLVAADIVGVIPHEPTGSDLFFGLALLYALLPRGVDNTLAQAVSEDRPSWTELAPLLEDIGVICSLSGDVLDVAAAESRLGLRPQDLLQRGLFENVHVGDRPAFLTAIADAAHLGVLTHAQLRLRTFDVNAGPHTPRHPRYLTMSLTAQPFAEGETTRVLVVLREAPDAATEDRPETPRADGGADQLFASMTHELRTPLNAIIGFSEMLASRTLRPDEPEKQRAYAQIVHQSGQQLLSLLDTLVDMSKLRSGTFSIVPESFDLKQMVESLCEGRCRDAEEAGVTLDFTIASGLETVVGDRRMYRQILSHLLDHALRSTPRRGRVILSASCEEGRIAFRISDTGPGFSPATLARLGGPLDDVGALPSSGRVASPEDGVSLGLLLVRNLVDLHGGTILFDSRPGEGSIVDVRLPLDGAIASPDAALAPEDPSQARERMKRRA